MKVRTPALILLIALFAMGCGHPYLRSDDQYAGETGFAIDKDAKIPDTVANRKVIDVLLEYRKAMVHKDVGTLRRLISPKYYDNGGTTDTTKDDYGDKQLPQIFELMAQHADQIKYNVVVKAVKVNHDKAHVDYEYEYAYQYKVGEQASWDAGVDVNRLNLVSENGEWKIISGL